MHFQAGEWYRKEKTSFGLFSNNLWNYSVESITKLENSGLIWKVAIVRKMTSYKWVTLNTSKGTVT